MTKNEKTAIQRAEKQLEEEKAEKLKNEVYNYLKNELEAIDSIDIKIRKLSEEKRAHEENVKNVKQGNLKAIEKRRKSYDWSFPVIQVPDWFVHDSGTQFYSTNIAGSTIKTTLGKTYIF